MSDSIVIRSMLFADVVGFSKLPDTAYPDYMNVFLVAAAGVLSDPRHQALVCNTWGDAIFAVFTHPNEAARAALALQALVKPHAAAETLGSAPRAPGLQLRIGLHSGPVHEGHDPITEQPAFMGKHINLAARIEPIAKEGHVYVSGEFAALATVAGGDEFQFDYVGQQPLPKKAGVIPVFRLIAARAGSA